MVQVGLKTEREIKVLPDQEKNPRLIGLSYLLGEAGVKLCSHDEEVTLPSRGDTHQQVKLIQNFFNDKDSVSKQKALDYLYLEWFAIRDTSRDNRAAAVNTALTSAWLTVYEHQVRKEEISSDFELVERGIDARYAFAMTEAMDKNNPSYATVLDCVIGELYTAISDNQSLLKPTTTALNYLTLGRAEHDISDAYDDTSRIELMGSAIEHLSLAINLLNESKTPDMLAGASSLPEESFKYSDKVVENSIQKFTDEAHYFKHLYSQELIGLKSSIKPQLAA